MKQIFRSDKEGYPRAKEMNQLKVLLESLEQYYKEAQTDAWREVLKERISLIRNVLEKG